MYCFINHWKILGLVKEIPPDVHPHNLFFGHIHLRYNNLFCFWIEAFQFDIWTHFPEISGIENKRERTVWNKDLHKEANNKIKHILPCFSLKTLILLATNLFLLTFHNQISDFVLHNKIRRPLIIHLKEQEKGNSAIFWILPQWAICF